MAVSRKEALFYLEQDLNSQNMFVNEKPVNLDPMDLPEVIRHSCKFTGITLLDKNMYSVPIDDFSSANLPYYYCGACGKLYVSTQLEGVGGY